MTNDNAEHLRKYFCRLFFFALLLASALASRVTQASGLYDNALKATDNHLYVENAKLIWRAGAMVIKLYPPEDEIGMLEKIIDKSTAERKKIFERNQKYETLYNFIDSERYFHAKKSVVFLTSQINAEATKNPESVKQFFRDFHKTNNYVIPDIIDSIVGIDYDASEKLINHNNYNVEVYKQWPKSFSQSDYAVIRAGLQFRPPRKGDTVYDLGSGYGRFLFYAASIFPDIHFKGIEIVEERTYEVERILKKLKYPNISQITNDVLKTNYKDGTYFFMFNPFRAIMGQVMKELYQISRKHKIVILSLGDSSEDLSKASWLKPTQVPGPFKNLVVFESL